tara:strand:- start:56 stop:205 length:150 start_codon:yes stop_codon:yes gene_type:complete
MIIYLIYILILLILIFITFIAIKAVNRGIKAKQHIKEKDTTANKKKNFD